MDSHCNLIAWSYVGIFKWGSANELGLREIRTWKQLLSFISAKTIQSTKINPQNKWIDIKLTWLPVTTQHHTIVVFESIVGRSSLADFI